MAAFGIAPWVWYVVVGYMIGQAGVCLLATRIKSTALSIVVVGLPMLLAAMIFTAAVAGVCLLAASAG